MIKILRHALLEFCPIRLRPIKISSCRPPMNFFDTKIWIEIISDLEGLGLFHLGFMTPILISSAVKISSLDLKKKALLGIILVLVIKSIG